MGFLEERNKVTYDTYKNKRCSDMELIYFYFGVKM